MEQVKSDSTLVAYCGLYCGECKKYVTGKCPGCKKNEAATWCRTRKCCIENNYASCADCKKFADINQCKDFNNFISRIFGFIFNSNRKACIDLIRKSGYEGYAEEMVKNGKMSIKRR